MMRFTTTPIDGAVIIDLEPHIDERGGFARTFCEEEFAAAGLPTRFPQCNVSMNPIAGTLRGMHFNVEPYGEAKLVRCTRGAIREVIIDLRGDSPTRFEWWGIDLTAENGTALYVPAGLAHGFISLEDHTDLHYLMSESYRPQAHRGVRWDDPVLGIEWPREPVIVSDTDASYPLIDIDRFDIATVGPVR